MNHHCDTCTCESGEEQYQREETERITKAVKEWAWNLSPTECALQVINRDEGIESYLKEMAKQGYDEGLVFDVEAAFEVLS